MLSLVAFAWVLPTKSASASPACSSFGFRYDGWDYGPSESTFKIRGASGVVDTYKPTVCTGSTTPFSGAWVMIGSRDGFGWAQGGYNMKTYGCSCLRFEWEWAKDINEGLR